MASKFKPGDIIIYFSENENKYYHALITKKVQKRFFKKRRMLYQYLILETGEDNIDTVQFIDERCKIYA